MDYKLSDAPLDYKKLVPGDTVEVMLEGKIYITEIDEHGTQRFHTNSVLEYMFRHATDGRELNMHDGRDIHNNMLNVNTLAIAFQQGKFDKRDYCEIVMSGYSVSGFCDNHLFGDWHLQNPVWGQTAPERIMSEEDEEVFDEVVAEYAASLKGG